MTGTGFADATSVTIGQTVLAQTPKLRAATGPAGRALTPLFSVVSATKITLVDPPGTGTVDIRVTTPAGTSPRVAADRFTYDPAATTPPSTPPSTSPTPPATTTPTSGPTTTTTTPPTHPTPSSGAGGVLATTGFNAQSVFGWGVLLVAVGAFLLRRGRRARYPKQH